LLFVTELQTFDRQPGDKLFDQDVLLRAVSLMPVPHTTATWEESRSVLRQMVSQSHETFE
jgi:hypothetical protein